ncbi:ImmA/IrrE family metallo-endopeptidase [Kibdelosporangium philippinense]|uniref:ImmA/IrrE family metallo-endopeptidase n=1 Tax=Kibdelosporangium philippinense TaxID=211113 RepID=A0ABS8ZRR6_9PSEU|nr:ImmA/IrrE family metallo-endopeptidase [Kibdelosporangium philippinense]MCE7010297.1 ImmA/IrrE family metallo-endopeptidase [Kibdelosporangium philippinense]
MTAPGSVAERLNWLFEVVVTRDPATGAWRPYTNEEAGGAAVERLRAGAAPEPGQLAALAEFFGIDPAYFGDDLAVADRIRDELLVRGLRECGLLAYWICRIPVITQREHVRRALLRERADTGTIRTWHDADVQPGHDGGTMGMTPTPMDMAQLRELCCGLVDKLGLALPFTPHDLCERLAKQRGRRIKVKATDLGGTSGVGHLAPSRDVDRIFVERDSPAPQQSLVIFHEVMHIVRDHLTMSDSFTCGVGAAEDPVAGAYGDWREWEAEVGARELARLAQQRPKPNRLPHAAGSAEQSIAGAFGFTYGR